MQLTEFLLTFLKLCFPYITLAQFLLPVLNVIEVFPIFIFV